MTRLIPALMAGVAALALTAAVAAYAQDDGDITRFGPETFQVEDFEVDGFVGTIEIIVEDRGDIEISAYGPAERMERFEVDASSNAVEVSYESEGFRWADWSTWVSWWDHNTFKVGDYPVVTVRVPEGTGVDVDGMTGIFNAGDLNGRLSFDGAGAIDATIGTLRSANIDIAGAADITLGDVSGPVEISIAGAGDIRGQSARSLDVDMSGASEIIFTHIDGGLDVSIAGVGEVEVTSVNGPVDISIAGAGDVTIDEGRAERFDVSIAGAGDVRFGGTAVDPDISIRGAGDVYIERYEGRLNHSGGGDITIGSGS
ncbi:DUF2807 domain-containing protein [bacterium AH-315-P15]|nr:DUF2807 domain-containing protein [bacterium AH-315-P15]